MRCPDCGYELPEHLSLCPRCGLNVEETQPIKLRRARRERRAVAVDETMPMAILQEGAERPPPTIWQRVRVILLAFAIFLCLLVVSSALGLYTGYRQGESDRVATRVADADDAYQRGLAHLDAGEYELAIAAFEYALRRDPDHPLASQGLAEAQIRLAARPTPTSQAAEDITRDLYAQGTSAYEQGDWETAARLLSQLRVFAPDYEATTVGNMLFTSLYNQGMALLEHDRFEEGIFYLDQALEIRPLDEEALRERELAHRYMTALGYWGVDWQQCTERFEGLYEVAPYYKDVFDRLYQAHVVFGDLWVERGEMCPAKAEYLRALELMNDPDIEQRQMEAEEICAIATPTPVPLITGTLSITGTVVVSGVSTGRLAFPAYNSQAGVYDVYALTSDGQLTLVAANADQPCWQWGHNRLVYRDRAAPGISLAKPGQQPVTLRADPGAAWPTLSPDGSRYAYAARDGSEGWQIYIAPTGGEGEPVVHAPGWGPAWGPTGRLAWTGCEADGSACGIFVDDNPDDDQPPTRLTSNINDTGLHWAPSGDLLAYMSDHTGNWSLYLLGVSGGVEVLTEDPTIEGLPAWSPDGSTVAFLSYREGRWGIYLMQVGEEDIRKIPLDLGEEMPGWQDQRLCWSP